jgi:hypothetical protein
LLSSLPPFAYPTLPPNGEIPTFPPFLSTFSPFPYPTLPPSTEIPEYSVQFSLDMSSEPYLTKPFGDGMVGLLFSTDSDCVTDSYAAYAYVSEGCHTMTDSIPLTVPNNLAEEELLSFNIVCDGANNALTISFYNDPFCMDLNSTDILDLNLYNCYDTSKLLYNLFHTSTGYDSIGKLICTESLSPTLAPVSCKL